MYPAELFVRRRKYDTPVFQSRHPALNEYIAGAVRAISEELAQVCSSITRQISLADHDSGQGNVDKVVVVIKSPDEKPLERFIFAVRNTLQVESFNKDTR